MTEKAGQIAHLDHDPSHNDEDNLAFLCLVHHDRYDGKTSQSKNYTIAEVKAARAALYARTESGDVLPEAPPRRDGNDADRRTLADILTLMSGRGTLFLRFPNLNTSPVLAAQIRGLITIVQERDEPQHEFLDRDLENLRRKFLEKARMFLSLLQMSMQPIPDKTEEWRITTAFQAAYPAQHREMMEKLENEARAVGLIYFELVREARWKLER